MDTFFHPDCLPFTVSLSLMALLCVYQVFSLISGTCLPGSFEAPDVPDLPQKSLGNALDWLNIGKVPVVVSLLLFFWLFGALGLLIQEGLVQVFGGRMPGGLLAMVVAVLSLLVLRQVIPPIAKILPKDETSAIDEDYVGRTAVITIGTATCEMPAEARVKDRFGRDRYIRVVPDIPGDKFPQSSEVLIVSRKGTIYTALHGDDSFPPQPKI